MCCQLNYPKIKREDILVFCAVQKLTLQRSLLFTKKYWVFAKTVSDTGNGATKIKRFKYGKN